MNKFWKEYGIIAVLIVVAISGYFLVERHKEDILSYSLDAVGNRLASLVDDEVARQRIMAAFDEFKTRVANDEVSSEQIEFVAANILNLSAAGTTISPEDAELILTMDEEMLPEPADPSPPDGGPPATAPPAAPALPSPRTPEGEQQLAKRLSAMVTIAESVQENLRSDSTLRRHALFAPESGSGVRVNSVLKRFNIDMDTIQTDAMKEAWIQFDQSLEHGDSARTAFMKAQHDRLAQFRATHKIAGAELDMALERFQRLSRLQAEGLFAPIDTSDFRIRADRLIYRARSDTLPKSDPDN